MLVPALCPSNESVKNTIIACYRLHTMDFSPSFLVQVDDALCDCVGELKQHTDRLEMMRTSSLDFDGFVLALGLALRSELPLRV